MNIKQIQDSIFSLKILLNKLSLKVKITKFLTSLQSFNYKVKRNSTDISTINTYLLPLIGDMESLLLSLQSLKISLDKLNTSVSGMENNANVQGQNVNIPKLVEVLKKMESEHNERKMLVKNETIKKITNKFIKKQI